MRTAITAASGKLGGEIIDATVALLGSENVVGLARTPSRAAHLGVEIREGDYGSHDELVESLQGVDCLLLVSGMDEPAKRVEQHRNVIQAAKTSGVTKMVYTSVQGAEDGTAFSPIAQSNRQTEADIQNSGLDWVIGRNGIYIEPDVEYIAKYRDLLDHFPRNSGHITRRAAAFSIARGGGGPQRPPLRESAELSTA